MRLRGRGAPCAGPVMVGNERNALRTLFEHIFKNYPLQAYDTAIPLPDIYSGPKAGMPTNVPAALGGMVLSWNPPRVRQHLPRRTAHLL